MTIRIGSVSEVTFLCLLVFKFMWYILKQLIAPLWWIIVKCVTLISRIHGVDLSGNYFSLIDLYTIAGYYPQSELSVLISTSPAWSPVKCTSRACYIRGNNKNNHFHYRNFSSMKLTRIVCLVYCRLEIFVNLISFTHFIFEGIDSNKVPFQESIFLRLARGLAEENCTIRIFGFVNCWVKQK